MAYDARVVGLHAPIKVRVTKEIGGKKVSRIIDATVGRIIFNDPIPQDLGYVDRTESGQAVRVWRSPSWLRRSSWARSSTAASGCMAPPRTSEVLDRHQGTGLQILHPQRPSPLPCATR